MEFIEFKNLLFEKAKLAGFEDCEIYFSDGESISISVYEQEGGIKGHFPQLLIDSKKHISWYTGGDIIIVDPKTM